jgi:mono/diheme cytochrome c family protein
MKPGGARRKTCNPVHFQLVKMPGIVYFHQVMKFGYHFLACAVAAMSLPGLLPLTAGAQPVPSQPAVVAPAAPSATVTAAAPPIITSQPVAVSPAPPTTPLASSVLAWDAEMKSVDVFVGDTECHLAYNFTNLSADNVVILNLHPGCGCTSTEHPPLPWTNAPGAGGRIPVNVNLSGKTITPGQQFKTLDVTTDKGIKHLTFRINVQPVELPVLTDAERARDLAAAQADRQTLFQGDCIACHVKPGAGKYGKELYDAACGICHEGEHRSALVPDLHALKVSTNMDFWRTWIAHGKPGTLMPAFAKSDGGPLEDLQVVNLATYLNFVIPYRPATNAAAAVVGSTNVPPPTH